ncbi:TonB-dependent receptor [Aquimarina sp. ERC-38]|uniref:TonB-dependent receptor n=1 Tax=Aquimarina sp. ERC-38 TaxID=2949996 RepID=UPI0022462F53|nr:TonB-dependent receptor [Aquimarina sp. ERC-38]UZO80552.1 TonB-dependent receptor [Aquimarina sp. ERC-38]
MHKFWLLILLFLVQSLSAQQQYELKQILKNLSELHNITFSYNSSEIENITVNINNESNTLKEVVNQLKTQTGLQFEKVDAFNYIVFKPIGKGINPICGKVVDTNFSSISKATVSVGNQYTKTDQEGNFCIEVSNKNAFVAISLTGYTTQFLPVSSFNASPSTIVLQNEVIQMDEVVIKNYIVPGLTKNENGSITVNMRKTGILPGIIEPDAIQTLQFIPGLQSPDETVTGLHIRGSTPDQNLILYDGVKVYQDAHFFGLLSAFNPYVIDNIQLYRSATKARYGGHAGGVISIGVDNELPKKITTGISTTLTHATIDAKIPIFKDKMALFASVRRGITDFARTITYEKFAEVAFQNTNISSSFDEFDRNLTSSDLQFAYEDYYAKLIFKPYSSLQFNFGFLQNQNRLSFKGLNPFFESATNDNLNVKSQTLYESISYKNKVLGLHKFQLSTTALDKRFNGLNEFDVTAQPPTLLEVTFQKENFVRETGIVYHGEKEIFKNGLLQIGYQRTRSELGYSADSYGLNLRTFRESFAGSETSQSFSSDFKFRNKRLHLNLGGRRQYFNRFHRAYWEPRAFLNYKLYPGLWIKTSHEVKHQSISQITDLRNDGLGNLFNRLWVVSTQEDIPVIRNNQTVVGMDFKKNNWTVDIEFYTKKLEGIGILLTDNIFEPRNVSGTNSIKGMDLLLKKKWNNYNTWLSYSYSESTYQFEEINNNIPFQGSFNIPHSLVWAHSLTFDNLSFSLGYRYRSGIPYTEKSLDLDNPQSNFIVFEEFNGNRLPDYHRLDFTANYTFYWDKTQNIKSQLGFTLQNITNERNILSRDFRTIETNESQGGSEATRPVLKTIDRISVGFTPNLLLRISF